MEDHALAIDSIYHDEKIGETYNIRGDNKWTNLDLVKTIRYHGSETRSQTRKLSAINYFCEE